ncbi:ferric reductase NAD binding domain-containing protein [Crassisporium funariophilum]|nr:ferric reductase NAD binding domain-containing protein [Crassisporium funariophilum]
MATIKNCLVHLASSIQTSHIDAAPAPVDPDKAIRIARFFSYPKQVLYLIASFIALISLCHFIAAAYQYATRKRVYQRTDARTAVSLRRIPAAAADSFRAIAFRWTIPIGASHTLNLAEVGLTVGYIGVLLSWTFVNTTATTGVRVEPHYYANRAGTIAASQLPIMTALGMRNNLISWLTGISFDKLNYLHRMSARVIVILGWVHAAGRISSPSRLLDDEVITNHWVQCGVLAASSLTLLCFLTIRPIRERSYEMFLLIHFVFAFIFVMSIYFHLTGRNLVYYGAWPSMVVWGLDRFLRLVRLLVYNFGYLNPWSSQSSQNLDAAVEVLSPQFLRLTLYRPKHFHWRPGQSVYLSFPSVSTFPFESHPFTIATADDGLESDERKLIFFLRVRGGFTEKLFQEASSDRTYKVFLNGPYSSPPLLVGYQSVVLIAGGSGVAFTLPLFLDLIKRAKSGTHSCQKVFFIWAIRDAAHVKWIADILGPALDDIPPSISVAVKLHITTTPEEEKWEDDSNENDSEEKGGASNSSQTHARILDSPLVKVEHGRPDLKAFMSHETRDATGGISVNVCGTQALVQATREAIRSPRPIDILRGGPTVTLHVEAFGGSVS